MERFRHRSFEFLWVFGSFVICHFSPLGADQPNILFIAVDDLRPELGCYGSPIAKSPHLDKLAAEGIRFDRAYCQQAICAPSRASLLTGTRPDRNGVTHNYVTIRELNPDIVTLPQHFGANGYQAFYTGKIFHRNSNDPGSWNLSPQPRKLPFKKPGGQYALPENLKLRNENMQRMVEKYGEAARRGLGNGPAYECADVPDHAYIDGYNTELAIATIKEVVSEQKEPFFCGLGFTKPHLNWIAPKKYWDLYDPADIRLASQVDPPAGGAEMGLHPSFELRVRAGIPKIGPLGDELSRTLLHAYYACVSYVDAQIGKAIAALEEAGVRDNTIIVVWGDHGWHLGEMGIWGKATNYEIAARVPLIMWAPNQKVRGEGTRALVELVDIFPTLCEMAGVPQLDHLDGKSFAALFDDPSLRHKEMAVSQFPSPALREWAANPLSDEMRETFFGPLIVEVEERIIGQQGERWDRELFEKYLMGYAIRTDRYRFIAWKDQRDLAGESIYTELFDHEVDPAETTNVASSNPDVVDLLTTQLNDFIEQSELHESIAILNQ